MHRERAGVLLAQPQAWDVWGGGLEAASQGSPPEKGQKAPRTVVSSEGLQRDRGRPPLVAAKGSSRRTLQGSWSLGSHSLTEWCERQQRWESEVWALG